MITTQLRDVTQRLLINRPQWQTLKQISSDTGIPHGWLKSFVQNKSEDPSVNRIETLYEYLTKQKLQLKG